MVLPLIATDQPKLSSVSALLQSRAVFNIIVDGGAPQVLACNASTRYTLISGLSTARHNVTLALRTEAKVSNRTTPLSATPTRFRGFVLDAGATALTTTPEYKGKMVVVGDSITAGWGNTNLCCGQPGARSEPHLDLQRLNNDVDILEQDLAARGKMTTAGRRAVDDGRAIEV